MSLPTLITLPTWAQVHMTLHISNIAVIQTKQSAEMDTDNSDLFLFIYHREKERVKKAVPWEYATSPKDEVFETLFQRQFSLCP